MELDILHRAISPYIVEFYGAFFIESCVYYCMEYMDAGSLDKLIAPLGPDGEGGVPEDVLGRIASCMVKGLKFLQDDLQIIHRGQALSGSISVVSNSAFPVDVKPTNVLVNRKGEVKLCDFGVSGQLEKSLAKTNIGCQSYMAVRSPFLPPKNISNLQFTARTNQRRIPKQPRNVYSLLRRLVSRSLDDRNGLRSLSIPARDLFERLCAADCHCPWGPTGVTGGEVWRGG
jgi:hypothetical protein